eukprot:3354802-Rhodomonas_salina.2
MPAAESNAISRARRTKCTGGRAFNALIWQSIKEPIITPVEPPQLAPRNPHAQVPLPPRGARSTAFRSAARTRGSTLYQHSALLHLIPPHLKRTCRATLGAEIEGGACRPLQTSHRPTLPPTRARPLAARRPTLPRST